jgi:putative endopeptidase
VPLEQGEAIADLGGLTIAWKAFQRTPEYKAHKKIGGYTPEQRFFIAYAQSWAGTWRTSFAVEMAKTDPHPENRFRVNGTLANMPEFRAAFACPEQAKMVRKNACRVW